jgi:CheY-like chemotaxis protein
MQREVVILVAEDSAEDLGLIERALKKSLPGCRILAVNGAQPAVAYFSGEGEFSERARYPLPDIVLSDLKMPNGDGLFLLEWLKVHPRFQHIPVIIMSGKANKNDSNNALSKGASAFLDKDHLTDDPLRFGARVSHVLEHI